MSSRSLRSHPLKVLLYLEWSLLAVLLASELIRIWFFRFPQVPSLNLICLLTFGALGFSLPEGKLGGKILYLASEFLVVIVLVNIGFSRLSPLLYLVIIIRNCFIFERRGRAIATSLTSLACILTLIERWQYRSTLRQFSAIASERLFFLVLMSAVLFGLMVLFLQLLVEAILSERHSREKLAIANTRLREYALQIETVATLQERNRIAREIHDSLGHSLTAFNLHLEAALRLLESDPAEAKALLAEAKHLGKNSLQAVRQSVSSLRADPLQGQSLPAAIATLAAEFQRSTGIRPECAIAIDQPLSPRCKTAAYRIVQEALTNICKYAEATAVAIAARIETKSLTLQLTVAICDNGRGFQREQTTTGFGLHSMEERARALNGELNIKTAPGQGCTIEAAFPISNAELGR